MTRRSRSPWPPQRPRHRCCERPGQRPRGTPWETVSARSTSFQRRSNSPQIRCHLSLQQTPTRTMRGRWLFAALRARDLHDLTAREDTEVMRLWSRRFHDLGRSRTQLLCRLHTVLCELVPGGFSKKLTARHAVAILDSVSVPNPIVQAKLDRARELLTDLQRIDEQRRDARSRAARAVAAS